MTVKTQEGEPQTLRKGIINRSDEPERFKKRSPTPVPGHAKRKEKVEDGADEQLEAGLAICELQRRLQSEVEEKQAIAKRAGVF